MVRAVIALYQHGHSWLHRLPAGWKLAIMAVTSVTVLQFNSVPTHVASLLLVLWLYRSAGFTGRTLIRQWRPLMWLFAVLFIVQWLSSNLVQALVLVLRIAALVGLAGLVTLTTPSGQLTRSFVWLLQPFGRFGLPVTQLAFMLSLTLRYIPQLMSDFERLREARQARGAGGGTLSLIAPLLLTSLRNADQLADAIDARGHVQPELSMRDDPTIEPGP